MPRYITLYKWTEKGIKEIKSSPERAASAVKAAEAAGIKVLSLYTTMGEYDLVAVSECPDDATGMAFTLGQGAEGFVRTTSMKAFTMEEFAEVLKKMP
jgi:uncharacterized protein with GYD domain